MAACCVVFFVLWTFGVAQPPLWSQHLDTAIFTSAGIVRQNGSTPTFAAATWLNPPIEAEVLNTSTTGVPVWTYIQTDVNAQFRSVTARHINSYSVGDVDVLVIEYSGTINNTCTAFGFASAGPKSAGIPLWTYVVQQCFIDTIDDIYVPATISDDGSTVFLGLQSNTSQVGINYTTPTAQLHAINAQTGKLLWVFDLGTEITPGAQHVSTSSAGDFTAWTQGEFIYVVQKDGTLRTQPIDKGYETPSEICPMGNYLTYGFETAVVSLWDTTSNTYKIKMTIDGQGQWVVMQSAISMNGGSSNPDGCLVAFGWTTYTIQQIKVDVYSMNTGKLYWSWLSTVDKVDQTLPELSFHMNYLAVATFGDNYAITPTIFLFNLLSNVPIFTFTTPGSMFEIGVLVNNAPIPTMMNEEVMIEGGEGGEKVEKMDAIDDIYIVAAGKDVPASQFGNGGDAYAFHLSFTS